jgi:hypothetical protein
MRMKPDMEVEEMPDAAYSPGSPCSPVLRRPSLRHQRCPHIYRLSCPTVSHFQKNVTGREIVGVLPSGLLYCRDGTLPMLVLAMRTPIDAAPMPMTPIA